MAKGTYRQKRDKVLQELQQVDPEWASQLLALRSSNPQAFRKEILRADVVLASKLGRPTTLSMRPKRFGGEEDPVLVRRVQELRRAQKQAEHAIQLPKPLWLREHGPIEPGSAEIDPDAPVSGSRFSERAAARVASGAGHGRQGSVAPAPDMAATDTTRRGWIQDRTPKLQQGNVDASPLGTGLQSRSPALAESNLPPAAGKRVDGRTPTDRSERPVVDAGPDLAQMLGGSVASIKKALSSGIFDDQLDAVEAAERAGKGRKSVLSAIGARRS